MPDIIFIMDYDLCSDILFNSYKICRNHAFGLNNPDEHLYFELRDNLNNFLNDKAKQANHVELRIGSTRQSPGADKHGEEVFKNGLCYNNYANLCKERGWEFNSQGIADKQNGRPPGTAFREGLKSRYAYTKTDILDYHLENIIQKHTADDDVEVCFIDDDCQKTIFADPNNDDVHVYFIDDDCLKTIFNELTQYLHSNKTRLPENIHVHLIKFNWTAAMAQNISKAVEELTVIHGLQQNKSKGIDSEQPQINPLPTATIFAEPTPKAIVLWEKIKKGSLSQVIKSIAELKSMLDCLTKEQRTALLTEIKDVLSQLIGDSPDNLKTLLTELPTTEWCFVLQLIEDGVLSKIITDTTIFKDIVEPLDLSRRTLFLAAMENIWPKIIKDINLFYAIMECCASWEYGIVYKGIKNNLPSFIQEWNDLILISRYLTNDEYLDLYTVMKGKLPQLTAYTLVFFIKNLPQAQEVVRQQIIREEIKSLPGLIKNFSDLSDLLPYIPADCYKDFFSGIADKIPQLITNAFDLNAIVGCAKNSKELYGVIKSHLPPTLQAINSNLVIDITYHSENTPQKDLVFIGPKDIIEKLFAIFKNKEDYLYNYFVLDVGTSALDSTEIASFICDSCSLASLCKSSLNDTRTTIIQEICNFLNTNKEKTSISTINTQILNYWNHESLHRRYARPTSFKYLHSIFSQAHAVTGGYPDSSSVFKFLHDQRPNSFFQEPPNSYTIAKFVKEFAASTVAAESTSQVSLAQT